MPGSGGTVSFTYDPFGRRIKKVSTAGTSIFAYDGDNLVEETNASGAVVARYSDGLNIDEPLVMLRSAATSYYHADGLGSITSLSNPAGALAQTYTFDSFGNQTASSGSLTNAFQYTAREFDPETNLYYYRARYYDPAVGRYISEDPIGFDGGLDFYMYVGNDVTSYVDPFGLIHYNKPPPDTVPVTGKTAVALKCVETCLQCATKNRNLDLLITGGAEQSGHSPKSFHYRGEAVDIPFWNPINTNDLFSCAQNCGFAAGQSEPKKNHWHLQLTPGNSVPLLPKLPPIPGCCGGTSGPKASPSPSGDSGSIGGWFWHRFVVF